ncbi:MAG: HAD-IIA family hydrolase [Clostridia bacterium]|nr:HAD-IIA family hydrolase [Clostridia bacterium]
MNFQNPDISFLKNKELYVFDMDGTVYLDDDAFPYAIRFIKNLREAGKRVLFFTNNASHSPVFYLNRLTRMGFDPRMSEIMSSGDVTAEFLLRHRAGKSVYLMGTPELEQNFKMRGIKLVDVGEPADIVITSFDTTLTYEKMKNVCTLVRTGSEYLSTHPDYNCPTQNGPIPDSGAISAFVTASTGVVPTYFGKPYRHTVEMICEATGVSKEEMCIFGDRLYTDIAVGKRHGITSILVYSGETQPEDVEKAEEADRPDFIFPSLDEVDQAMFS